jgi:hypothetical protein
MDRNQFDRDFARTSRLVGIGFLVAALVWVAIAAAIIVGAIVAYKRWA